jgi:hypothetical protein
VNRKRYSDVSARLSLRVSRLGTLTPSPKALIIAGMLVLPHILKQRRNTQ